MRALELEQHWVCVYANGNCASEKPPKAEVKKRTWFEANQAEGAAEHEGGPLSGNILPPNDVADKYCKPAMGAEEDEDE